MMSSPSVISYHFWRGIRDEYVDFYVRNTLIFGDDGSTCPVCPLGENFGS